MKYCEYFALLFHSLLLLYPLVSSPLEVYLSANNMAVNRLMSPSNSINAIVQCKGERGSSFPNTVGRK